MSTTYQALGTGPVSFLDSNQNQQEIPLNSIIFGSNGADASAWPSYAANKAVVDALLKQMVQQGLLAQGTPTPQLSLTVTAAGSLAAGNSIVVTFSNPSVAAGTMTVTVSSTEIYAGLTPATVAGMLGASPPGNTLVSFVSQAAGDPMPLNGFTGPFSAPGYQCEVLETSSPPVTAFTLAATDTSYVMDATIAWDPPSSPPSQTFTLTITGTKTKTGVILANLAVATTNPFALLVTFSVPAGGPLPAPSVVTLQSSAPSASVSSV